MFGPSYFDDFRYNLVFEKLSKNQNGLHLNQGWASETIIKRQQNLELVEISHNFNI